LPVSALKDERVAASKMLKGPKAKKFTGGKAKTIEAIKRCVVLLEDLCLRPGLPADG
jgi:6-phosphogluconate dehydrogenase